MWAASELCGGTCAHTRTQTHVYVDSRNSEALSYRKGLVFASRRMPPAQLQRGEPEATTTSIRGTQQRHGGIGGRKMDDNLETTHQGFGNVLIVSLTLVGPAQFREIPAIPSGIPFAGDAARSIR